MQINRKELRDKLAALRPGLAKREFVQQSCHFIFMKNEIATFNDKICLIVPFESEEEFSVKGEEVFRLIDGIAEDTIEITLNKGKIKIKSDTTTATMVTVSEDDNKLPPVINALKKSMKNWKKLPSNFTEGISLCSFSTTADLSRGVLACVALFENLCYSLDTNRSSYFELDEKLDTKDPIFIVGKDAVELAKFPVKEYCTDGKWAHFKTDDDVVFSCILMSGKMPFEKMSVTFSKMDNLPHIELPSELRNVVDNVTMLATIDTIRSGKVVQIQVCANEITVSASNELGDATKVLPCEYADEEINIEINSGLLSQILQRATSLSRDGGMLHFKSGSFQHILMANPTKTE